MKQFTLRTLSAAILLGLGNQASAHVEYYDLNQFAQIGDLTANGKALSTAQYGNTPAGVVALGGIAANGLATISTQQDLPLNNPADWNASNQSYTGVGVFSGTSYNPATGAGTATVDVNDVTTFGWYAGTTPTLGDSHKVDFFNFRLAQAATVNITWNVDIGGTYIDSAFTLYNGVLNYQGHDDGNEKLNPKVGLTTKVQDALDSASAPVDVQGIASSFRNTTSTGPGAYVGQFNALANWGQANVAGNWSNAAFIQAANNNTPADGVGTGEAGAALESLTVILAAGNYSIAASGAIDPNLFTDTNYHGQLTFSATSVGAPPAPVPLPAAVWLFGTALAGFGVFGRRNGNKSAA